MSEQAIEIVRNPSTEFLENVGVFNWPIWEKEISTFPWRYEARETCYFLEGDVVVTPEGGEPVQMGKGDLVTFSAGLACSWEVRVAVRKHYTFG